MVAKIIVGTDEKGFVYPKVQERTDITQTSFAKCVAHPAMLDLL